MRPSRSVFTVISTGPATGARGNWTVSERGARSAAAAAWIARRMTAAT